MKRPHDLFPNLSESEHKLVFRFVDGEASDSERREVLRWIRDEEVAGDERIARAIHELKAMRGAVRAWMRSQRVDLTGNER
ncbi:MAG: hypothetical protein KDD44_03655, partial [Bdellovibrionales bacterium]|nr:hypothetical protein [Bdellovibrionales bacterium]